MRPISSFKSITNKLGRPRPRAEISPTSVLWRWASAHSGGATAAAQPHCLPGGSPAPPVSSCPGLPLPLFGLSAPFPPSWARVPPSDPGLSPSCLPHSRAGQGPAQDSWTDWGLGPPWQSLGWVTLGYHRYFKKGASSWSGCTAIHALFLHPSHKEIKQLSQIPY